MNRRVQWRGHRFLIGRLTRLRPAGSPATSAVGCDGSAVSARRNQTASRSFSRRRWLRSDGLRNLGAERTPVESRNPTLIRGVISLNHAELTMRIRALIGSSVEEEVA